MKIFKAESKIQGIPDYYAVSVKFWDLYKKNGDPRVKAHALHYARVAAELGQAVIEEEITQEV